MAETRALGGNRPAVKLNQSLHQGEADAKPPLTAFEGPIHLGEHLKHLGQHPRRDPEPGVGDADNHFPALP